jgi:alkaline phosphatase D
MPWAGLVSTAFILLTVAPGALAPAPPAPGPARTGLLVTVGEVSDTRAALWVRADDARAVTARYRAEGAPGASEITIPRAAHADGTGHAALTGLRPATRYTYEVTQGKDLVRGAFRTAPAAQADVSARLLWSGDLGGAKHCRDVVDGYAIFDVMTARAADLFVFLGDTVYADQTCAVRQAPGASFVADTLGDFHAKHRYNRADPAVQRFFRTTPVFAIWDDHEVRNNFVGPDEPLMPIGRRAFLDYWPIVGPAEEPTRLYRRVRWGRHLDVFILDVRQYRSANAEPDGPGKTMLGPVQRAWLLDGLRRSDATWKVIASTVPLGMFTGGASSDSWAGVNVLGFRRPGTGFVHERDVILTAIRDLGVDNVVVLSGDVHHAELIRHEPLPGLVLHEFVAGPLAARQGFKRFLDRSLRSRSLGSLGWAKNFGELTADAETLTVHIVDGAGATRVRLRLPAVHRST